MENYPDSELSIIGIRFRIQKVPIGSGSATLVTGLFPPDSPLTNKCIVDNYPDSEPSMTGIQFRLDWISGFAAAHFHRIT